MHEIQFMLTLHTNDGPRCSYTAVLRVRSSSDNPIHIVAEHLGIPAAEAITIISHTQVEGGNQYLKALAPKGPKFTRIYEEEEDPISKVGILLSVFLVAAITIGIMAIALI